MSDPVKELDVASAKEDDKVAFWNTEITLAKKRDKEFWQKADRVVRLYEGEKHEDNSFNILYANTETLLPACYNQLPRPFVDRRFHDPDPLAKLGAQVLERTLTELTKCESSDYDPFSALMEQATLGALIPGRGVTWFRYEARIDPTGPAPGRGAAPEESGIMSGEAPPAGQVAGHDIVTEGGEKVTGETICGDDVDYDEFLHGYGRRWTKVPWVARRHQMTREDVKASFDEKWVELLAYTSRDKTDEEGNRGKQSQTESAEAQHGSQPTTTVWEIWNKDKKQVIFYSPTYRQGLIDEIDDPLKIPGFFPCPEPLRFLIKRSKLTPTPLYTLYEEQAKELNRATQRINRLLHALKVRGFYDGTIKGMKELLNSDDNTLLPAKDVAALQDGKTLENSIWLMPLDKLIVVLQHLWSGREQIKETIYEITGIADIMRGEGEASATATQERIKNQWGTLRLKRMQRYVQEYVRACLNIMGSIASNHFSLETFSGMTNLDFAKPEEIAQAKKVMQYVQQFQMQQAQAVPPQAQPGPDLPGLPPGSPPAGPPPQPQLPPQLAQMAQQAQATLAKPPWEPIIALLRNDALTYYKIDIETNSTIADTTQEDKENITDAMTALGNMFQTFQEPVVAGALPMPALKAMTLAVVRRFNFGREVEDSVNMMPDKLPPPPPDPKAPSQAEMQLQQLKIQADTQKTKNDQMRDQQQLEFEQQQHQMKLQQAQLDSAVAQRKEQADAAAHGLKLQQTAVKMKEMEAESLAKREEAATRVALATHQRETAAQVSQDNVRSAQAQNMEKERAAKESSDRDLAHKDAEATQKRDLDKKAAEGKMDQDRRAGEQKIAMDHSASTQKASREETDNKAADMLAEVIRLLKTPVKATVGARDKDGKILHLVASRE